MSGDAAVSAEDPAPGRSWPVELTLRDGSRISVRPIEPGDRDAIAEGFRRLSEESRYRRFLAPMDHLTAAQLAYLTEVDHRDHEALIARGAESGEPVGVARFVRSDPASDRAEVAVTVVDDWHRRGVAGALLGLLSERAREEGVAHFTATMMGENRAALEMFHSLGPIEHETSGGGTVEICVGIPDAPVPIPDAEPQRIAEALRDSLRAAARGELLGDPLLVLKDRLGLRRRGGD